MKVHVGPWHKVREAQVEVMATEWVLSVVLDQSVHTGEVQVLRQKEYGVAPIWGWADPAVLYSPTAPIHITIQKCQNYTWNMVPCVKQLYVRKSGQKYSSWTDCFPFESGFYWPRLLDIPEGQCAVIKESVAFSHQKSSIFAPRLCTEFLQQSLSALSALS